MTTRDSLLAVTARLYAEHGWRGTTTRGIAEAAGVNEVTLFRQFGSKQQLLLEAIEHAAHGAPPLALPAEPADLRSELAHWALAIHRSISHKRGLIRACLAEGEERPSLASKACQGGRSAFADVHRYLGLARKRRLIGREGSITMAATMLINTIFLDAMTRDVIPAAARPLQETLVTESVDLILRGLKVKESR